MTRLSVEVTVAFERRAGNIGASLFRDCAELVLRSERRRRAALSFVLLGDESIRAMNARFLGHDWATDVITFPLEDVPVLEGEVVIGIDAARRQAREFNVSVREELARLAIHGVLHLCGYDDTASAAAGVMKRREDMLVERWKRMSGSPR